MITITTGQRPALERMLDVLRHEKADLECLILDVENGLNAPEMPTPEPVDAESDEAPKRQMTAAGREAISAAQKKRWAKARKGTK